MDFDPPKEEGVCDICGGHLEIRDDDKPEVVRRRLGTYHEKTEPLVAYYEERGLLYRMDGLPPPDEVAARIRALLATVRKEEEL
jgi:adenylate kinase